mgnify:CR=1 FL=1
MAKKVLVPVSEGTEEMEAITIIDMLRRAELEVIVAGESDIIKCSRMVKIIPDVLFDQIDENDDFDAIVLPGGNEGTKNLSENEKLKRILERQKEKNRMIGAICAAPTILSKHKILSEGQDVTSHPGVMDQFENYEYKQDKVVDTGMIVTSRGAGTAIDFSLNLIEKLADKETADKVGKAIVYGG